MEVVDYIEGILNSLDFTIEIESFTQGDGETILDVCKTYHARTKSLITIGGQEYNIKSVVNNTTIIIEGEPVNPTEGTLKTPNYFYGTATAVNNELSNMDKDLKFPMLYCYEIIPEKFYNAPDSAIDREAEIRLYFLDNANFQDWTTKEHYNFVIKGMKNFQKHMIEKFNSCPKIGDFEDFNTINHVKFGVWTDRKGHTSRIFNEKMSGVELLVTLPLLKDFCDQFDNCNN